MSYNQLHSKIAPPKFVAKCSILTRSLFEENTIRYRFVLFKSFRSTGNGGCILCESGTQIKIDYCRFHDAYCDGEGGALYIRSSPLQVTHSCFCFCRTAKKENDVGGNVWNVRETDVKVSDIEIARCWIDSQCGESICFFFNSGVEIKLKNSSHCIDNLFGEDICHYSSSKNCFDSFINTINCSLSWTHSTVGGSGKRESEHINVIDCKPRGGFMFQYGSTFSLNECCFFRISKTGLYGTPAFFRCIGDFELSGITKVATESTHKIHVVGGCSFSFGYSDRSQIIKTDTMVLAVLLQ